MQIELTDYLRALALTIAIECPVAFALGYRALREQAAVALCSVTTHPLLHVYLYSFYDFDDGLTSPTIFICEAVVVIAEFFILCAALPKRRRSANALAALAINAASYVVGLML